MPKKKTHKVIVNYTIPFSVIGIASNKKTFVVSNELNRLLEINLSLVHPVELLINENKKIFDTFSFQPDEADCIFSLISNHGTSGSLLENYHNLDYFFIISGSEQTNIDIVKILKNNKSSVFLAVTEIVIKAKKRKA